MIDPQELTSLCHWLRANSSGVYRPAARAADLLEQLSARTDALAWALCSMLDGMKEHEIQQITGLPPEDCELVWAIFVQSLRPNMIPRRPAMPIDQTLNTGGLEP